MSTPLNSNPVIIDEPGTYRTRHGLDVEIHDITPQGDRSTTSFNCKGHMLVPMKVRKKRVYNIWHESGAFRAVDEHPYDIIEKVK